MTTSNENTMLPRRMEIMNIFYLCFSIKNSELTTHFLCWFCRKLEEVSRENTDMEAENKKMQKTIETLKVGKGLFH
jgi:hypothetical protein